MGSKPSTRACTPADLESDASAAGLSAGDWDGNIPLQRQRKRNAKSSHHLHLAHRSIPSHFHLVNPMYLWTPPVVGWNYSGSLRLPRLFVVSSLERGDVSQKRRKGV